MRQEMNTAEARYELFGHQIVTHHQLTFEQQIRDVFVEEIHNGRWEVGSRLPGILALAKKSGFGTKTMYNAFEMLRKDGYVEMRGNRGTFLTSLSPSKRTVGKIGVLLTEEQRAVQLILWYQHIILNAADKRDMITEVKVLPDGMDPRQALLPGTVFNDQVAGIISLTPFDGLLPFENESRRIPYVFLCPPYESCVPKVTADVEYAYYELTHRMFDSGHRRVAFSYESVEMDRRQADMHLAGYRRAMAERGLPVDEELIERSRILSNKEDLVGVTDYLKHIVAMDGAVRPTAMVCGSLGRNTVLTSVAPLCSLDIPEQLSVASIGSAPIPGNDRKLMTGMLPDFDKMMDACFSVLDEYGKDGGVSKTNIFMQLNFVAGNTLMALNGAHPEKNEQPDAKEMHRINSLSEAVHY
jgi:DNA-binding LacI/PurR family transcriptional regulator/DNA-binding transcriptional regulator YhcF (GntR family)